MPLKVACQGDVDTSRIGSYRLVYKAHYKSRDYTAERVVNVVDTTPPEITLISDPDYQPNWFDGYVEEGYTATDAHDGDLTGAVEVSRSGSRMIYSVTDAAGNTAQAERDINYIVAEPQIELFGDSSVTISARPRFSDPGYAAPDDSFMRLIT